MAKASSSSGTASGLRIAMILLGIAVTPVLLSSSSLGNQLPAAALLKIVLTGGVILTLVAAITICVGEKARMPTYGIVKYAFGEKGALAINLLLAISLFGWIVVTANMFGNSVHNLLTGYGIALPLPLLVMIGCVIFVACTAFGFAILGKLAQIAVPIIALMIGYILWLATSADIPAVQQTQIMDSGVAISSVVGTIIVLVTLLPDFGSSAHNRRHALIAAVFTFLLAYPLLYWAGAMPGLKTGKGSLLSAAAVFGAVLPAALLLIFACITANAGNLFQGTLVVATLFSQFAKWKITLALGILAAMIGSIDINHWFIPFLLFLGIATPPIAGIYIADFWLFRRQGYQDQVLQQEPSIKIPTFLVWLLASAGGFMTAKGWFTLTTIPALDSILLAALGYALFSRLNRPDRKHEK